MYPQDYNDKLESLTTMILHGLVLNDDIHINDAPKVAISTAKLTLKLLGREYKDTEVTP
ncbi:MAG: hypothetical protein GY941_20980 [Planctomycetes bacterium]|nr:hypothetical protein [Planctomycetota bacterium]